MNDHRILSELLVLFNLPLNTTSRPVDFVLAEKINLLIQNDFEKLVQLLYRVDVSESKLKTLLQENKQRDAADLIATLVIDRLKEKQKSRDLYSKSAPNVNDAEEKW